MFVFLLRRHHRRLNSAVLILLVLCFAISTTATTAHGQDQCPAPEPDVPHTGQPSPLPPRPTPQPPSAPGCIGNTMRPRPEEQYGGRLTLYVPSVVGMVEDKWAVVQWQDDQGAWHDVDGWRSQLGSSRFISWWVAPKDAGTGPFRWLVYTMVSDQQILWTSTPFLLPGRDEDVPISSELAAQYVR